jgi:hypothetical protein
MNKDKWGKPLESPLFETFVGSADAATLKSPTSPPSWLRIAQAQ